MKEFILFILGFLFSLQPDAQIIKKENRCIGFGKFILGELKTKFNLTAIEGGIYKIDNREFSTYCFTPLDGRPVEILNISLNFTIMTFDDSDRLVCLHFEKFYKKSETPWYEKEAKKYYRQLINYFTGELGSKGVSKIQQSPYKKSDFTMKQVWSDEKASLIIRKSIYSWYSGIDVIISTPGY